MTKLNSDQPQIRQGIDIEKFRNFRAFAAENPEAVIFGLAASGVAEGRAVHTLASTGPYTLGGQKIDRIARRYQYHFGAHGEVEAALGFVHPTDREQETEVALAALAGCINAVVTVSAAERGADLESLRTDVGISWDPSVFLHLRDTEEDGVPVDQFGDLVVTLSVSGRSLSQDDIDFIKRTVQRSAIFNLFSLPRRAEVRIDRIDTVEKAA